MLRVMNSRGGGLRSGVSGFHRIEQFLEACARAVRQCCRHAESHRSDGWSDCLDVSQSLEALPRTGEGQCRQGLL